MRLVASSAELEELFAIEFAAAYEPFVPPPVRDRRKWTIEDSELLEPLYVAGISIEMIASLLGHTPQTVRQWAAASQLQLTRFAHRESTTIMRGRKATAMTSEG
jgi:hypothetical protein